MDSADKKLQELGFPLNEVSESRGAMSQGRRVESSQFVVSGVSGAYEQ
jgi:hypothetical protein